MGCSTCKSKRKNKQQTKNVKFENVESNNTPSYEDYEDGIGENMLKGLGDIGPQSIGVKIITFIALIVAIPLFALYMLGYIFKLFFFSKNGKNNGVSVQGLFRVVTYPIRKWRSFRSNLREKSREREFAKTVSYDDIDGISVLVDEELVSKRKYEGKEELKDIELVLTDKTDNNND